MKPIKEILSGYKSLYAAERALGVTATQLSRWRDLDALVDSDGYPWIKTGKKPLRIWPETNERIDNIGVNGPTGCHYQASVHLK